MKCWEVIFKMEITYLCKNNHETWSGYIRTLSDSVPYEFEVSARGSSFHMLVGKHAYGNYLCILNWGIGTELSFLSDRFWNTERLRTEYPELSSPDVISIVNALAMLGQHIRL